MRQRFFGIQVVGPDGGEGLFGLGKRRRRWGGWVSVGKEVEWVGG